MALLNCGSTCPCGSEVKGRIRKPTPFTNSFLKLVCKACGSRFLITCVRDKGEKERVFTSHVDLLFLSDRAKEIQKNRLPVKAKIAATTIAGAFGVEPKPDTSVVKVDMDE